MEGDSNTKGKKIVKGSYMQTNFYSDKYNTRKASY